MRLYDAVTSHDFSEDVCFLCGARLSQDNRTVEHVFPKWVLREFDLWNQTITLLNGTQLPYRNLVIPCCKPCNNGPLSHLERRVEASYRDGFAGMLQASEMDLLLWSIKIIFGILYREVFLPMDRANPAAGVIVSREAMENYKMLHYILQAVRIPMRFHTIDNAIPGTVFLFDLKMPPNRRLRFNFKDDIFAVNLYLQLGPVGVLAAFDQGAQAVEGRDFFGKYQTHQLHPLQFSELGAMFFMKSKMLTRTPKFLFAETETHVDVTCVPIAGLSLRPVFEEWDRDHYGTMLSEFVQIPIEVLRPTPELTMSWLSGDDGVFPDIDFIGPWAGKEDS